MQLMPPPKKITSQRLVPMFRFCFTPQHVMPSRRSRTINGSTNRVCPPAHIPLFTQTSGQALVLGLLLLSASCIAAVGFIRLARLLDEKSRAINAADAAAYSTGVLHARLLNYDAYTNRALIANEIARAQWLRIGSWSEHLHAAATRYQTDVPASLFSQAGLQVYLPQHTAILAHAHTGQSSFTSIYQQARDLAQKHDEVIERIRKSQNSAHTNLAHQRRALQTYITHANFDTPHDVYGWHVGGHFQGIDEGDAQANTETPFTQEDVMGSAPIFQQIAHADPFLSERNTAISGTTARCGKNKYNRIMQAGYVHLIPIDQASSAYNGQQKTNPTFYWSANDSLIWETYSSPPTCQPEKITLGLRTLNNHSWHLSPSPVLRSLSDKAKTINLPRHTYRFRVRYQPQLMPEISPYKKQHPNIRSTVEVYFRPPKASSEEKGDLLHAHWQVRLVNPTLKNSDDDRPDESH